MFRKRAISTTKKKLEADDGFASADLADAEQLEKLEDIRFLQSTRVIKKGVDSDLNENTSTSERGRNGFSGALKTADDASTMTLKRAFREQIDGSGEETRKHMEDYIARRLQESENDSRMDMMDDDPDTTSGIDMEEPNDRVKQSDGIQSDIEPNLRVSGSGVHMSKSSEYRPVFQGITGLSEVPLDPQERLKIAEETEAMRTGSLKPKPQKLLSRRRA